MSIKTSYPGIDVDTEMVCKSCELRGIPCEGSRCAEATEQYLEEHGITCCDASTNEFKKFKELCIGDEIYIIDNNSGTPIIKQRLICSLSQVNDGKELMLRYWLTADKNSSNSAGQVDPENYQAGMVFTNYKACAKEVEKMLNNMLKNVVAALGKVANNNK